MKSWRRAVIEETAEKLGWKTTFYTQSNKKYLGDGKWSEEKYVETYVDFETWSPAGQDVILSEFYKRFDDIPEKLYERYCGFDVDYEVEMWLEAKNHGSRGIPGVRTLVEDAEWQEAEILKLSDELRDALEERRTDV